MGSVRGFKMNNKIFILIASIGLLLILLVSTELSVKDQSQTMSTKPVYLK